MDVRGFADYRAIEQWARTGASDGFSGSIDTAECTASASRKWLRRCGDGLAASRPSSVVTSAFDIMSQISAPAAGRCVSVAILPRQTSCPMTSSSNINHRILAQTSSPACRSYGADCAAIIAMSSHGTALPAYPRHTAVRNATP
jgi:hypothetical protein